MGSLTFYTEPLRKGSFPRIPLMPRLTSSKLSLVVLILWGVSSSSYALAQPSRFAIRASIGVVHLPLSDWSSHFGFYSPWSQAHKDQLNLYGGVSFHWVLSSRHSVSLSAELIRTAASAFDILSLTPISTFYEWQFQGVPITLGYEYTLLSVSQRMVPVFGMGISYFISQVETTGTRPPFLVILHRSRRTGHGYGLHASLGVKSQVGRHVVLLPQIRYRYADGTAFSRHPYEPKVEFSGLDTSFSVGWAF